MKLAKRNRIREHRLRRGFTQQSLADYIGVRKQSISAYEYGVRRPSPAIRADLARALGVSVAELFP